MSLEQLLAGLKERSDNRKIIICALYCPTKQIYNIRTPAINQAYVTAISKATGTEYVEPEDENESCMDYWADNVSKIPPEIPAGKEVFSLQKVGAAFELGHLIDIEFFPDKILARIIRPKKVITDYLSAAGWKWEKGNEK